MIVIGKIHPPTWRLLISIFAIAVFCCVTSVLVSIKYSDHATEQRLRAEEKSRHELYRQTCDLTTRILAGYAEAPPTTATGKSVVEAWREEFNVLGCQHLN
jgi:hypothetical protein